MLRSFTDSVIAEVVPFTTTARPNVRQQLLEDARQLSESWKNQAILRGKIHYIEDSMLGPFSHISVPALDGGDTWETWGYDMETKIYWPVDGGALITAIFLFCSDRDENSPHNTWICQSYFRDLKQLTRMAP